MSVDAQRFVELCRLLSAYADRPGHVPGEGAGLFEAVDPLYRELEAVMQAVSAPLAVGILADPALGAAAPSLHRLRAAYEYEKEILRAREVLDSDAPSRRLADYMRQEVHWALGPELRGALRGRRAVLVAGSGALPLTAIAIGAELEAKVTVLERDAEAFALGMRLIDVAGLGREIEGIQTDIAALADLGRYDAVVGAVLLGVESSGDPLASKTAALRHVLDAMRPGAKLILREPHGLGRLLYPSAELGDGVGIAVTRHEAEVAPNVPYRSGLIVARRLAPAESHADPSALPLHP